MSGGFGETHLKACLRKREEFEPLTYADVWEEVSDILSPGLVYTRDHKPWVLGDVQQVVTTATNEICDILIKEGWKIDLSNKL
jgi:hypothetical protein